MNELLYNPVFQSLLSEDQHLGFGTVKVKAFDESVSPFAGFETGYAKGFEDLYNLLPPERKVLYATPAIITELQGWQLLQSIKGLQFVFGKASKLSQISFNPLPLEDKHITQMVHLAALTKPGPFGPRTIEFGFYFGVFEEEQLVAMTGQRLHVGNFTEVSAVCTHPGHLGKGYASALLQHQVNLILEQGKIPFLHVRADNERAIAIYQRLGFKVNRNMNFYFLQKGTGR